MFKIILLNLFIFSVISVFLIFNPHIFRRVDGVTITINQASFYIPGNQSIKIYLFDPKPKNLEQIIEQGTSDTNSEFGVVVKNLSTGQELSVNADKVFNAASLYKLAVMYTLFDKAKKGQIDLNKEDIKNNLNQMITVSSNEAALYLVENYTPWKEITETMKSIGLNNTNLDQDPIVTTPYDMAKLLELIANGQAVSFESSVSMLKLLSEQKVNDRIPVHLPPTTVVAHKTGELDDVRHDAGVVITPENNYVLVLMSKDSKNPETVKAEMADLSKDINDFFISQWVNPPEIL